MHWAILFTLSNRFFNCLKNIYLVYSWQDTHKQNKTTITTNKQTNKNLNGQPNEGIDGTDEQGSFNRTCGDAVNSLATCYVNNMHLLI